MIEIQSKKQGAELTSIKLDGKEKLHQGIDFWQRHAPVLFPIVGQIKDGKTLINGKEYFMSQHGFARDMDFEEIEKKDNIHKYLLKSNEETLKKFPFEFEFYITYEIENNILKVKYEVINKDENQMLFGLGGHPAFLCNYSTGNFELQFNKQEDQIEFLKLDNGLLSNKKFVGIMNNNKIKLHKDIFAEDAIIMKNVKSNIVSLVDIETNNKLLDFDFTGFPYLAIWSKKGAPFVCIEPWFNTADKVDSNGEFKSKENILKLEQNKKFECEYNISFYNEEE